MNNNPLDIFRIMSLQLYDTEIIRDMSFSKDDNRYECEVYLNFTMGDELMKVKLKKVKDFFNDVKKMVGDPYIRISSPITHIKHPDTKRWMLLEPSYLDDAEEMDLDMRQVFKITNTQDL